MIKSPLNYIGGKHKLLPQILPLFPKNIDTFVDLFCGGCNVGINIDCDKVIYNDNNIHLQKLYEILKKQDSKQTMKKIFEIIDDYNLSLTSENGYEYYGCNSSAGLSAYNREGFFKLRKDFNQKIKEIDINDDYYLVMYVLIVYSFNNQIRFNSEGEFNLPVGKRDFNKNMQNKLLQFIEKIKRQNCYFTCSDFRDFDISSLTKDDLVYVDPPYLISCATYNEQGGWNNTDELDLLDFLDCLQELKVKFALSNVLRSKGKQNLILLNWLKTNKDKYKVHYLDYSYSNSNYHTKDKETKSEEVLVVNY